MEKYRKIDGEIEIACFVESAGFAGSSGEYECAGFGVVCVSRRNSKKKNARKTTVNKGKQTKRLFSVDVKRNKCKRSEKRKKKKKRREHGREHTGQHSPLISGMLRG